MLPAVLLIGFVLRCSAIAVTGVSAGVNTATGARPFRTEINSFAQSGPAFDLYIQALRVFQNQSGDLSYFGISGTSITPDMAKLADIDIEQASMDIHFKRGMGSTRFLVAATTWDTALTIPSYSQSGTDRTWQSLRYFVSVLLLEYFLCRGLLIGQQAMWSIVNTIASQYPSAQRQTYTAAVNTWRIPYWDWADVRTPGIPSVLSSPQITINTPSGRQTVTNPLYAYRFPNYPRNIPNMGQDFEGDRLFTVRHPNTGTASGGNAKQDDQAANQAVLGDLAS